MPPPHESPPHAPPLGYSATAAAEPSLWASTGCSWAACWALSSAAPAEGVRLCGGDAWRRSCICRCAARSSSKRSWGRLCARCNRRPSAMISSGRSCCRRRVCWRRPTRVAAAARLFLRHSSSVAAQARRSFCPPLAETICCRRHTACRWRSSLHRRLACSARAMGKKGRGSRKQPGRSGSARRPLRPERRASLLTMGADDQSQQAR